MLDEAARRRITLREALAFLRQSETAHNDERRVEMGGRWRCVAAAGAASDTVSFGSGSWGLPRRLPARTPAVRTEINAAGREPIRRAPQLAPSPGGWERASGD
jgi:hypothetical protein